MFIFTLYIILMWSKIKQAFKSKEDIFLLTVVFSIPLYFILDANNQFPNLIPVHGSLKILSYTIISSCVFFFALILFVTVQKAAVLLSVYSIWYLFFKTIQVKIGSGHFFSFINNLGYYLGFSVVLIVLFTAIVCFINESSAKQLGKYLNLLFLILFLVEAGKLCFGLAYERPQIKQTNNLHLQPKEPKIKTDIYLIVMDGYAGDQSLRSNFGYDNSKFFDNLREDSFFVAAKPNSNYNSTLFSMSSMFNLNYSNSFILSDLKDISAFGKAAKEIKSNALVPFLVSSGYEIKNFSGFPIQDISSETFYFMAIENRLALEKTFGNVLKNELFTRFPSNSLQRFLGTYISRVDNYNQVVYNQCVKEFSEDNTTTKSKFVYVHFFMPHDPFLNKKDGTARKYSDAFYDGRKDTYRSSYVEYLQFTNQKIDYLINLLMRKKGNKVVLLVSDHGERFSHGEIKDSPYNNFFAVYNSQKDYTGFNDTFSLTNTFRVVLNSYFNQQLPLLESKKLNVYTGKDDSF